MNEIIQQFFKKFLAKIIKGTNLTGLWDADFHLILSECYSLDFPLSLEAQSWNHNFRPI